MINKLTLKVFALSLLICGPALAAGWVEQPVAATPFDQKMATAGFNYIEAAPAPLNSEPLDALFAQARSFRYAPDGPQDRWQTPGETEARRSGDCEDKALWLYAKMKQSGYDGTRLVVGRYRGGLHVWVTATDTAGDTVLLDPTAQKRIWKAADFTPAFYRPLYSFDGDHRYRISE